MPSLIRDNKAMLVDAENNKGIGSFSRVKSIAGWTVFLVALIVYFFSAERTGSLWDVGEFILGAYKLEVVHPPGAPLFMLIGRMFTWVAELISNDPADIAFAVNLMSGVCTAIGASLLARITMMLGKLAMVGRSEASGSSQNIALGLSGVVAGLSMAFCSSIWFSAVEGEVYAMSTMFTVLTIWTAVKWFYLPDNRKTDKWLVFTALLSGLSIGVHLLSLLTWPAVGVLYYLKKYKNHNILGALLSFVAGAAIIVFIQKVVIVGIPTLWKNLEIPLVNSAGLPFHSGLVVAILLIGALVFFLLRVAHKSNNYNLQLLVMGALMICIGFSTIGVIVIRANADTPVNMNAPSDAVRILPYINREQYGERALVYGNHFDAQPQRLERTDRHGRVGDKYEIVDQKLDYVYRDQDKMFFPRIGHAEGPRPQLHRQWYKHLMGKELKGRPSFGYNLKFMFKYQFGWMYWRYFMWNFAGRQNGSQGFSPWDVSSGHWASGVKFIDEMRLHDMDEMTDTMKNHKASNHYYFLPLIFGLIGFFFHARKDPKTFAAIFILFLITGLGLIIYSNQPPNEPRERDYVLVGSFLTFCIWIGMSVLAMFSLATERFKMNGAMAPVIAGVLALSAPIIMGFQNFDDHSRMHHLASRDYASNFLNSVDENAIIFTYGDNDTYPLWYAQEVENIRRDVRVVNLSLIAVDWYIEKLRRKVNDSDPIKLSIPSESYRGNKRNQITIFNPTGAPTTQPLDLVSELAYIGNPQNKVKDPKTGATHYLMRSSNFYIRVDREKMIRNGVVGPEDVEKMVPNINITLPKGTTYITKDELAVLDVLASNIHDRPVYFAVTCKNEKLMGINDYTQLEGLGLRVIPVKTPSLRGLSIYGSGRVDAVRGYDNIMGKWKWGNFDTRDMYVDNSYAAEIQAMKIVMMRTAEELTETGQIQKAAAMSNKFFESFPHFNFPYDESVTPFIDILNKAGDKESAKKHLKILAEETRQKLVFYDSLDERDFESFRQDHSYAVRAVMEIFEKAKEIGDQELITKFQSELGEYDISKMRNLKN